MAAARFSTSSFQFSTFNLLKRQIAFFNTADKPPFAYWKLLTFASLTHGHPA